MRKAAADGTSGNIKFNRKTLDKLLEEGYNYVQVRGLTIDKHYDYIEPSLLVLVPLKELPVTSLKKDIYEPVNSELLYKWAAEKNENPEIVIVNKHFWQ